MVVKMNKEFECNVCGEKPCKFTVTIENEKLASTMPLPEDCPFHSDCNFKAKWVEKRFN